MTLCFSHRKEDPFVRLDKRIVFDQSISWKAKGILSYAFSRPEDWSFYRSEMIKHSSDGETSFDSGIKELEKSGYLHRYSSHDSGGKFKGLEWHFFEIPISEEEFKKRYRNGGNPGTGETPAPVKSDPTKNDLLNENKKNNNNSPKKEASPVVVFPIFNELEIPKDLMERLTIQMDEAKASKLVERVKAWKGRMSDAVACNTILKQWSTWEDNVPIEDARKKNLEYLKSLNLQDGMMVGHYTIDLGPEYINFRHPCVDGSKDRYFKFDKPDLANQVKSIISSFKQP